MAKVSFGLGLAALVFVTAGLLFGSSQFGRLCDVIFVFVLLSPLMALLAIALGLISRKDHRGRVGLGSGCATLGLFWFFLSQMGYPPCGERIATVRASAIGSLRTIDVAEITYASTYDGGYSPDLASLGPGSGGSPSASAAGLIDSVLATGRKSGYIFTYTPGQRDPKGRIASYTVTACPITYDRDRRGSRTSFFTDETGVIRQTDENRPPTAQDQPIPP
jgi:hypothetical protein